MSSLHKFVIGVVIWLPICFGAWYFFSILSTLPLAKTVNLLFVWLMPDLVERITQSGNHLLILGSKAVDVAVEGRAAIGEISFQVNPLKYAYSIPLYTALVLATPASESDGAKLAQWLIGIALLFLAQVIGVSAEILKVFVFQIGTPAQPVLDMPSWGYDALALIYQLGYLILPSVAPIMIWFGQFQRLLPDMIAAQGEQSGA